MNDKSFRDNLRRAISNSGMVVKEVAKKADLPKATIDNWVAPEHPTIPNAKQAAKVARALGTTVEALVFGEEPTALGSADKSLLAKAKKYQAVLEDLLVLDDSVRNSWITGIHAAAEVARVRQDEAQAGA